MASKMIHFRFLAAIHIKELNKYVEGASTSVLRDEGLLESAVVSPINQQHYGGVNDLAELAAVLSVKLIKNHAFGNGNKRTALLAANMFLARHGMILQEGTSTVDMDDVLEKAHSDVAQNKLDEPGLAAIYRTRWRQASSSQREQAEPLSNDA
ncbi:MAG: hypothetical protein Q9187_005134 [Circinaria calcarea]